MGFTSERLEKAVKVLRERGHVIPTCPENQPAAVGPDGLMILIDGRLRHVSEIYEMAENAAVEKNRT
jgi:hypothetical protein